MYYCVALRSPGGHCYEILKSQKESRVENENRNIYKNSHIIYSLIVYVQGMDIDIIQRWRLLLITSNSSNVTHMLFCNSK